MLLTLKPPIHNKTQRRERRKLTPYCKSYAPFASVLPLFLFFLKKASLLTYSSLYSWTAKVIHGQTRLIPASPSTWLIYKAESSLSDQFCTKCCTTRLYISINDSMESLGIYVKCDQAWLIRALQSCYNPKFGR